MSCCKRHAVKRQLFRVRLDPDLLGRAAGDVAQADIVDLGQLGAQLHRELVEVLVGPALGGFGLRRQRQHHDRDVVDAAADDQRLGDPDRDAIEVGADFFVHAQDRVVRLGADEKPRGHHDPIVLRSGCRRARRRRWP